MPYQAARGGHAPSHLREAWITFVEDDHMPDADHWPDGRPRSEEWLIGQLWNCTDIMPSDLCASLDMEPGSTYAQGVRAWRKWADFLVGVLHAGAEV